MAIAASKLDDKGVSFEFLAVEGCNSERTDVSVTVLGYGERVCGSALTRHHVLRVIGAFILNEAESIHELDFSDCTMAELAEKLFNFLFPSCC